ncbi:MAG: carboxypeptidase-like regulatory domain-containing protein [Planctomycetota bacterium]
MRPPTIDEGEVRSAIRRIEAPSATSRTGDGVIRGRAVQIDGAGLPGATVVVSYREPRSSTRSNDNPLRAAPERRTLDEALRRAAEQWAESDANTFRTTTLDDGSFEVSGLVQGSHRVRVYAEGFQIESGSREWVTVEPGGFLAFTATPLHLVTVDLRLPDGSQPELAALTLGAEQNGGGEQIQWTPESPRVAFANTRVRVRAGVEPISGRFSRSSSFRFESEEVFVDAASEANVRIDLAAVGGIDGRVVFDGADFARPLALEGARVGLVELEHAGASFDPESIDFAGDPFGSSTTVSSVSGRRFHFARLSDGSYGLALRFGGAIRATTVVDVESGFAECELVLRDSEEFGFLAVTATGSDGSPLRGLRLRCRIQREDGGSGSSSVRLRSMPDGRLGVPFVELGRDFSFTDWPEGTSVFLEISHPDYGEQRVSLVEGQREVEVRFQEPAELLIQVPDAIGSPLSSKLRINLRQREGQSVLGGIRTSYRDGPQLDEKGNHRLSGLVPADYELSVSLLVGSWRQVELSKHQLTLRPGEQSFVVGLPALHPVAVQIPGADEGTQATLRQTRREQGVVSSVHLEGSVGADGRVVFPYVLEGTYQLRHRGSNASMEISVPTAGEVVFRAEGPDTLRVAIADESGTMFQSGLRSSDIVLRVNDVAVTAETLSEAWRGLSGGPARLEVLRAGERVVVNLSEAIDFGDQAGTGGTLIPGRR